MTARRATIENGVGGRGILAAGLVGVLALAACGDEEMPTAPPVATEVSISPEAHTFLTLGETRQFFAAVSDQYGEAFPGTITWSGSAPEFFTVDANGTVTAVANGSGTVTASYQSLSASASVTVDANLPPEPTGEFEDILVSVGGAAWPFLAGGLFRDPDNDVTELVFAVTVSDPAVASVEVVVDDEGHTAIIITGTAAGSATLAVTATDPGGLSGELPIGVVVDDWGYTPLPGIKVDNNKIDLGDGFLTLTGTCTPPIRNTPFPSGLIVTINSSQWHTRSDSSSDWVDVPDTEVTTGQLCTYATRTPGEYRLVLDVTTVIDPHLPVLRGAFRAENTFIVEESTGENRAPTLNEDVPPAFDRLSVGGGPLFTEPSLFFTDPDGDELAFSLAVSDSNVVAAEIVTDTAGHRFLVATGATPGSATLTLTATDPAGLSADLMLEVDVDDEGLTPFPTIGVDNGVILLFGRSFGMCLGPFVNTQVARYFYTVHSMRWQTRADPTADWTDIEGTMVTDGRLCPHTATAPGDYRMVMDLSVQPDEHIAALRGLYTAANMFTVSGGG
ncbi:MAG: Ig-like domain-containing protein [Gemmatimonadetes bacterium]|nr:Ig-like domain-containing protein [Gemmatimonadota bacterium]